MRKFENCEIWQLRQHRERPSNDTPRAFAAQSNQPAPCGLTSWCAAGTLHRICLIFFRHTAQKSLDIRQYACKISVHSDEKIYCASSAQSLCGIALSCRQCYIICLNLTSRPYLKRDTSSKNKPGIRRFNLPNSGFLLRFFYVFLCVFLYASF